MNTASSYTQYRKWITTCNSVQEGDHIDFDVQYEFITSNLNSFIGWILFHIGSIGTNGKRQLFYITFTCVYFGLSRDGINALNQFGYGVPLTAFDDFRCDSRQDCIVDTRYIYIHIYYTLYYSSIYIKNESSIMIYTFIN